MALFRPMDGDDSGLVRRVLYLAAIWRPDNAHHGMDEVLCHEYFRRYHEDWGRSGDFGVAAEVDGAFAGGAYGRLFTEDDHGHGFVNPSVPEIAIGVEPAHRGMGIGTGLLHELALEAIAAGMHEMSLSVERDNPARALYERIGWVVHDADDGAVRMRYAVAT